MFYYIFINVIYSQKFNTKSFQSKVSKRTKTQKKESFLTLIKLGVACGPLYRRLNTGQTDE